MEQTTQQISQTPQFPIRTKIAAWWMTIIGGIIISFSLFFLFSAFSSGDAFGLFVISISVFLFGLLLFFLPGVFLLKRKKIGWHWTVISILILMALLIYCTFNLRMSDFDAGYGIIGAILLPFIFLRRIMGDVLFFCFVFIFCLLPFIYLLLDRKNFFKIVS